MGILGIISFVPLLCLLIKCLELCEVHFKEIIPRILFQISLIKKGREASSFAERYIAYCPEDEIDALHVYFASGDIKNEVHTGRWKDRSCCLPNQIHTTSQIERQVVSV